MRPMRRMLPIGNAAVEFVDPSQKWAVTLLHSSSVFAIAVRASGRTRKVASIGILPLHCGIRYLKKSLWPRLALNFMSRIAGRLHIFSRALPRLLFKRKARPVGEVKNILIAHRLRLGDALLLAPLLKKLRLTYPHARIAVTCAPEMMGIFSGCPYRLDFLPYDPRDGNTIRGIVASGPYDLAFVLGDNRYAWLALAAGSRWIIAHDADMPAWKRLPIDDLRAYPDRPGAWGDLAAQLIDGPAPPRYVSGEWTAPEAAPFDPPGAAGSYVVLHPGANSPVKQWLPARWRAIAASLEAQGLRPVWSGGPAEVPLIREIDPAQQFRSYAGQLDLGQLWHLLANAKALACPDTGIAHLGRMVGVPTLALFGPGSALVHGAGEFWADVPYRTETLDAMPCRNQQRIFSSPVSWARRCDRNMDECLNKTASGAACMTGIGVTPVQERLESLMEYVA